MTFEVAQDRDQPTIQNDGMPYEGLRFRTECRLAGKLYGQPFGLDIAFRDRILGDPETITTDDLLAFAPRVYHAAHTPEHSRKGSARHRIARHDTADRSEAVADRSGTNLQFPRDTSVSSSLPLPPAAWIAPYTEMARSNDLAWTTIEQLTSAAGAFLNAVLAGSAGIWNPESWRWEQDMPCPTLPHGRIVLASQ